MFEIEDCAIQVPSHRGRPPMYPWASLEVGQSFFIPNRLVTAIGAMVSGQSKKDGRKYTCRTIDNGVRVWRTG